MNIRSYGRMSRINIEPRMYLKSHMKSTIKLNVLSHLVEYYQSGSIIIRYDYWDVRIQLLR